MSDRDAAQQRVDRIRAFRAELEALRAAGVSPLSDEQHGAIAAYHDRLLARLTAEFDVDATDAAGRLSRGMRLASFFAAVTLTGAVYSLVSQFWGRFDLPLQATLLCAFPLMALVGVHLAAERERTLYVASLFGLVAYGTFWLAVWVLTDTLNIPLTPIWLWAGVLFGLSLALAYRFRLILAMTLGTLIIALSGSLFAAEGHPWTATFERLDALMIAAFASTLLAPQLAPLDRGFAPVTRLVGAGAGLLALVVMSSVGDASRLPYADHTIEWIYQAVFLVVSVSLLVAGIRRGWRETVQASACGLTIFLLVRYADWFWDALPRYLFFSILAIVAFGWLAALGRLRRRLG